MANDSVSVERKNLIARLQLSKQSLSRIMIYTKVAADHCVSSPASLESRRWKVCSVLVFDSRAGTGVEVCEKRMRL
jgi:hypothetical protein